MARIRSELGADDVAVERGLALVMIVGECMRNAVGLAARATAAFAKADVNIEMINQGSSEVSMMFGVKTADMDQRRAGPVRRVLRPRRADRRPTQWSLARRGSSARDSRRSMLTSPLAGV